VWSGVGILFGVVVNRSLCVDDHRLRVVAANLHVTILAVLRMPRRGQRAELLSTRVLKALQLQFVFFAAAGAALVRTSGAPVPSTLSQAALTEAAAGSGVGCCEAKRRHELADERAKGGTGSSSNAECGLCAGPEGDIECRVKEVLNVRKSVYVRNPSNGRNGGPEIDC